ncbi:MAG: glycosyltransferase family 2 protein [Planctomycetota bacterium]
MKISIVIPTRNRSEFLRYCVQTCLACDDDNIEIIVSDNNSVDETRQCIEALDDPRLRYICTAQDLSMRQNFEFALGHTSGDYIIYIGDDDGILPNGLKALRRVIDRYQPDVLLWRHITYNWPTEGGRARPGQLKFRCRDFCGPMKRIEPRQMFRSFCQAKHINYRDAANIYHGCVRRCAIDKVRRQQDGVYFNDISPDMNTALSNLVVCESILWFRNPVTIAGAGEKSTGYAFNPRGSVSRVQRDVTEDYCTRVVEDEVPPKLSVKIRSIAAHTYANLCQINSAPFGPGLAIDHEAWQQIIVADLKTFLPELRRWDVLEAFFAEVDPGYQHQGLLELDPEAISMGSSAELGQSNTKGISHLTKKKRKKHAVPDSALRNVETVMRWLDFVTGKPYTPSTNTLTAFTTQAWRSIGMRVRATFN